MKKKYARLTVDMSSEEHTYLKIASAQMGVSMRRFILLASFQMMKGLEDEWLRERADETIRGLTQEEDKSLT